MVTRADKYTSIQKKEEIYSDFFTNFTAHPDTGQLVRATNEEAVKRSIRSLLLTDAYERLFQPSIRSNIKKILFEDMSPQTENSLRTFITSTIENHEPRCKLIDVEIIGDEYSQTYMVNIIFYVINKPSPVNLQISLKRIR